MKYPLFVGEPTVFANSKKYRLIHAYKTVKADDFVATAKLHEDFLLGFVPQLESTSISAFFWTSLHCNGRLVLNGFFFLRDSSNEFILRFFNIGTLTPILHYDYETQEDEILKLYRLVAAW